MKQLRCKMCGGTLHINESQTTAVCEFCGSTQALPKVGSDAKTALVQRAEDYRRANEFDSALELYEKALEEDTTDAEIYWSILLCRYGVEYVKDPRSGQMIPTINRTQTSPVNTDPDFLKALRNANPEQRSLFEQEAERIDNIQKNIWNISKNEEPFDIFLCYKETDSKGRRTDESVYANEMYELLTKEGYKVFFARITLQNKIGTAYEPYIFSALNSSKVMVVVGTSKENFESAWVKNEWSRYLNMIKNGEQKTLIPAYKNMDPYDLPQEFSYLQALNMANLGFMQDLIGVIQKLVVKSGAKPMPEPIPEPEPESESEPEPEPKPEPEPSPDVPVQKYPKPKRNSKLWIPIVSGIGVAAVALIVIILIINNSKSSPSGSDGSPSSKASEKTVSAASAAESSAPKSSYFEFEEITDYQSVDEPFFSEYSSKEESSRRQSSFIESSDEDSVEEESEEESIWSERRFSDDNISIEVPKYWLESYYSYDYGNDLMFYEPENNKNGSGGLLFGIIIFNNKARCDNFMQGAPRSKILTTSGGKYYVLYRPTDVQYSSGGKSAYQEELQYVDQAINSFSLY